MERGTHRPMGWELCCLNNLEIEDARDQLDLQGLTHFIINAQVRHTIFVIQASGGQHRDVLLVVLQNGVDRINIAAAASITETGSR